MVTYKQAGVDIDKANLFVEYIKGAASKAFGADSSDKLQKIGFFSGFYLMKGIKKYRNPVIVSSCDGVGTKLKLAFLLNKHNTVGKDLVAMNVNDIITCGARPLFFLDYFACGKLDLRVAKQVIEGIIAGCKESNCILLGGETAEMPGFYNPGEYDLAGFAVGVIEKEEIITGENIVPGDIIIGLPSSGVHSNGFSLIRKIFSVEELKKYGQELLKPTAIYVNTVLKLLSKFRGYIKGIANITGGGFYDNILRILPTNCIAVIYSYLWKPQKIFSIIQQKGNISAKEMFRTFNCGIGMVLVVDRCLSVEKMRKVAPGAIKIGEVEPGGHEVVVT
jgi:phosphoribosylformylglycinamidine cyclo-ligase